MKKFFTTLLFFTLLTPFQLAFAQNTTTSSYNGWHREKITQDKENRTAQNNEQFKNDEKDHKDKSKEEERYLKNKDEEKRDIKRADYNGNWRDKSYRNELDSKKRDEEKLDKKDNHDNNKESHYDKFYPNKNKEIRVTDGNYKIIKPDGTFIVNGKYLGKGRWYSENRYAVLVKDWGNLWWVGILVPGGMNAVAVEKESEIMTITSQHFEKNY